MILFVDRRELKQYRLRYFEAQHNPEDAPVM